MMDIMERNHAPFGDSVWKELEQTLVTTARAIMVGRRMVEVEGPYGFQTAVMASGEEELVQAPWPMASHHVECEGGSGSGGGNGGDAPGPCGAHNRGRHQHPGGVAQPGGNGLRAAMAIQRGVSLALIHHPFHISARNVAAFEHGDAPLDTSGLLRSIRACVMQEEALIFLGHQEVGPGLTLAEGANRVNLADWEETQKAVDNVVEAAESLDRRGVMGPYALALAPNRFDRLFRNHGGTPLLLVDQLSRLITGGIYKARILDDGGVLLAMGSQPATLLVGQDLTIGLQPTRHMELSFMLLESVALQLGDPEGICILGAVQK